MSRSFTAVLLTASASLLLLTSCSSAPAPSPGTKDLPHAPLAEATVECMKDLGQEATVEWDGTLSGPEMRKEQLPLWQEAYLSCAENSGYADPRLDVAQIKQLYVQEVAAHQCLLDNGFSSPEPPSEAVYIDSWNSSERYTAVGSSGFGALTEQQTKDLTAKCPPPTWFLDVDGL